MGDAAPARGEDAAREAARPAPHRDAPDGAPPAAEAAPDAPADADEAPGSAPDAAGDAPRPQRPDASLACETCAGYDPPRAIGALMNTRLDETSGLAASRAYPGVFYAHNDRGNAPEVFAFSREGRHLGRFLLADAPTLDIEDLALGPCPAGTCLYLADTGNNRMDREEFAILRTPEPAFDPAGPTAVEVVPWERFTLRYPDRAHDVEAMLVDPRTGQIWLITKPGSGPSAVYRLPLPLDPDQVNVAQKVLDLPVPRAGDGQATGASAHPCAPRFLLRTYRALYEFRAPAGGTLADALRAMPLRVPAANEPLAEAVTYLHDGAGYITVSEGNRSPVNESRCAPARP